MINKADVLERLKTLVGKELSSRNLHEALFCEKNDSKRLRRFNAGTHTYVDFKIYSAKGSEETTYALIKIPGNPNTFKMDLTEKEGNILIQSEPKINYSYL
ncbi:hypothetical protein [Halalkalibacter akibai]|uniref:Uncharacterized protein n=1 Tax=Halalkalibacter akibai (strain ATCC 43226 / DSM 21942 / CIP 109018 / JCM 9157 / 1139) TaxID=1236973 RepID=W4QV60_HALA3|nr:hypothetical protein [Halalkalibacter akibai]GAE35971.1 hypothetical protein JCM9157_3115 [Halalkalibacter akibai JCM 9157]